ncbi:MAG: carboxymuconolactone decarboxylase family protein, partial [Solirubrobacterales bacterium]
MRQPRTTTAAKALRETAALAARTPELIAIWGRGRLDSRLREEVMLAIAQANACDLCTLAHRRWAIAEGVTDEE